MFFDPSLTIDISFLIFITNRFLEGDKSLTLSELEFMVECGILKNIGERVSNRKVVDRLNHYLSKRYEFIRQLE